MIHRNVIINKKHKVISLEELEEVLSSASKIIISPRFAHHSNFEAKFIKYEKQLFVFEDLEGAEYFCETDEIVEIILEES